MPKLRMLVGLPCVGKSTWIENQKFEDVAIVSTDKHIDEYAKSIGQTYNDVFPYYYNEAKKLMDAEIALAVENKKDIVWDQTNLTIASRSSKLLQIPSDYVKIAVVFKPIQEKKYNKLLKQRKGKIISQRVILMMKESYEEPKISEGFDCIQWVEEWTK
ncbi:AAA domain containing protein [uncultured Caudovirales phage]|uniref:AAA domain containing protein n=1 Tax=uncultured Caudovirales phage TaxID=2100421 RepID=A0A6J5KYR3_9CAUD|nr:AAA domain containing protein [uncultured Caudovirales phage]